MPTGSLSPVNARVGLLMATCQQSQQLKIALESLLSQSHHQFTLTLVLDGQDPESEAVVASFSDPRLKLLQTPQTQGLIASLNLAMRHSKPASFYAVVYATCFYAPNFLVRMLKALLTKPGAAGVFCSTHLGKPPALHPLLAEPEYRYTELLSRNFLGRGILFRAEVFQQAGGLFLSEKQGIWETWKRMARLRPFIQVSEALIRATPDSYAPPVSYQVHLESDILPFLKLRCLVLDRENVDAEFLRLLHASGHEILTVPPAEGIPDLLVIGSLLQLEQATRLARRYFVPVVFVTQSDTDLAYIYYQKPAYMRGFAYATATPAIVQRLKQIDGQEPVVYFQDMKYTDFNRQLSRIPQLLTRFRTTLLVRAYTRPVYLQNTLNWLQRLSRPEDWGNLLIFCPDAPAELLEWLKTQPYTWYVPREPEYFPELLHLLRQLDSALILGIDAGVLIPPAWYFKCLPYLRDPRVGMVSSLLHNSEIPEQRLPFALKSLQQFEHDWAQYAKRVTPVRAEPVSLLSDSLFLMRRHVLERVLLAGPSVLPLGYPATISHLLGKLGYQCILTRDTAALNLIF